MMLMGLTIPLSVLTVITAARAQEVPKLRRVATIGCAACGGPTQFATISDVVLTDSGRVLVLGSDPPIMRLFERDGRVVWTAGRDGAGPGEFRRAMRAAIGPNGIQVVDMTLRRVSRFSTAGVFLDATALDGFPASVSARRSTGELFIVTDDFRGTKTLHRWAFPDSAQHVGVAPQPAGEQGAIYFASVAVAPSGAIAYMPDGNEYRIVMLSSSGATLRELRRDIARVPRTPAEIAALERIRQRAGERVASEASRGRGARPLRTAGTNDLKPHVAIDGLRFDDAGRLWVRTMRGDETRTVFDLFAPDGRFLGELTVPASIGTFSLAGKWLAADIEAADGSRMVALWELR